VSLARLTDVDDDYSCRTDLSHGVSIFESSPQFLFLQLLRALFNLNPTDTLRLPYVICDS
jgi:hypothetical protein